MRLLGLLSSALLWAGCTGLLIQTVITYLKGTI